MICWLFVQVPICPHCSIFGDTRRSGFSRPIRFRSPSWSIDGLRNASGASSKDNSRMPRPLFIRLASVPASQYDAPLAVSYTHLRAHETPEHLVCRLLLEK